MIPVSGRVTRLMTPICLRDGFIKPGVDGLFSHYHNVGDLIALISPHNLVD